jgi:hypothetical protein
MNVLRRCGLSLACVLSAFTANAATLTVNSAADDTTSGNGLVTLREAVAAANADGSTDLGQTGSGADSIVFAPSLTGARRSLCSPFPFRATRLQVSNA